MVYWVRFRKEETILRKAKGKKGASVPVIFFSLSLVWSMYTAIAETHWISHCSPAAGDLKSGKGFLSRLQSRFYLKFVFLSEAFVRSLLKKKKLEEVQLT